jgi:integrase
LVALKKLKKTWPGIESLEPKQITPAGIFEWVSKFKMTGTNFVPPGAKTTIKGNSATSVNRSVDTLRRILDIAIERGQIHSNPVLVRPSTGRLKKKVVAKKLILPSMSQVEKLFCAMEENGAVGGWGKEAADLCRFLTYSGARIGEVPLVNWEHVDWERKQMRLCGYKTDTSDRHIPLFPALAALLKKIIGRRKAAAKFAPDGKAETKPENKIFRLKECQKSIDGACARAGVPRVTHHDFRHLFATICIESGVDIPTVSAWLGHNDGGVLAMKTYGHLRRDHSQAAAVKVKF